MAFIPSSGSVVAFQSDPTKLQVTASVAGNVGASIIGLPTVQTGSGSVITVSQGSVAVAIVSGSIAASFTPPANQSVSGTVQTQVQGSVAAVIIGGSVATATTNSSVMLLNGPNVIGSVAALQGTSPWLISSVYGNISGSVVSFPGAGWPGSVLAVISGVPNANTAGSVVSFTNLYRNDTLASMVGVDQTFGAGARDSAGRLITKPFVSEDGTIISYTGSVTSTSVTLIQASALGKRSYITDFFIANSGATTTVVTFQDGSTSILGVTIAPTGGGSNAPGITIPLKTAPSQDLAFKANSATSILYLTIKGYQAP